MEYSRKISFILPCYGVENYISNCLDSIFNIDLAKEEYEVICVNDCSTDGTRDIIVEYQKYQCNLILIDHEVNKKQGGARNTGLRFAKGKYCWFVDPDDFIKTRNISSLIDACEKESLEIYQFNYEKVSETGQFLYQHNYVLDSKVVAGVEFINLILGPSFLYNYGLSVYSRLYLIEFLRTNSINFIENTILEDLEFSLRSLLFSKRIQSVSNSLYCYRDNPDSTMNAIANKINGNYIFQVSIIIGKGIVDLANDIEKLDGNIRKQLFESGIFRINHFTKLLLKTSISEQHNFFLQLMQHQEMIVELLPLLNYTNKVLVKFSFFSRIGLMIINPFIQILLILKKNSLMRR